MLSTDLAPVTPVAHPRSDLKVVVIVPAYNEAGKIGNVVRKIPVHAVREVVVVDDCSSDATAAEARTWGATVLRHLTNQGVGAAIRTGIDYARQQGYDVVAILAGDDQHDPRELPRVLELLRQSGCDLVQGSRRLGGLHAVDMPWFRRITTAAYNLAFRWTTGFRCTDATNGFRAFRLKLLEDQHINLWQDWLNRYELEPYLLYQAVRLGKRVVETPVTVVYHQSGTTKMRPFADWWRIARPLVFLWLGLRK